MTWEDVKKLYTERTENLKPRGLKSAQAGMVELEELLKKRFPEILKEPLLLRNIPWYELHPKISPWGNKDVSRNCYLAFHRVFRLPAIMANPKPIITGLNAERDLLGKHEVMQCFSTWLLAENWQNVKAKYFGSFTSDMSAEKDGRKYVFYSVHSAKVIQKGFTWEGGVVSDKVVANPDSFKKRLSRALLYYMEEKNIDKSAEFGMLVTDDDATRELIKPYTKHIKKIGIKIYMVKSSAEVTEL